MLPQHRDNNVFHTAWWNFEQYLRNQLVMSENKELYIISGGIGSADDINNYIEPPYLPNEPFIQSGINYPEETWKIAVVLELGQTLADITENTRVIAIITPNEKRPLDLTPDEINAWQDWGNWRVSVDDIEAETGLNLLSNIPKNIQDDLEDNIDSGPTLIAGTSLTANLLGSDENQILWENPLLTDINPVSASFFDPFWSFKKTSILPKNIAHQTVDVECVKIFGSSEISGNQNSISKSYPVEISPIKFGSSQNGIVHLTKREVSSAAISSTQVSPPQISMTEIGVNQFNTEHFCPAQVGITEVDTTPIDTSQVSSTQINSRQIHPWHQATTNSESSEVSFSSGISFEQILTFDIFHNSNSQIIDKINNTILDRWNNHLNPQIPIEITYQITDLPAGQLAEATITSFADNGENSEFGIQNSEMFFEYNYLLNKAKRLFFR
jgi:hypothetical protein